MTPSRSATLERAPAHDLDAAHDPGPGGAAERTASLPQDVASEALPSPSGGTIRVGTASWTDPTMTARGVFYPDGADSAEERLGYYASRFPLVEVDATYYALPSRRTAELWVERTPPDFTFDVKAHALMTGQPTETKRLPKELRSALPDELAAKPGSTPGTSRTTCACRSGRGSSRAWSRCVTRDSSARSCSSTPAGSSPAL